MRLSMFSVLDHYPDRERLVPELYRQVIDQVRDLMAKFNSGEMNRFDVFAGEIIDNKGEVVVPAGEKMEQADLDQFPPGAPGLECEYCMYWWDETITSELPELE